MVLHGRAHLAAALLHPTCLCTSLQNLAALRKVVRDFFPLCVTGIEQDYCSRGTSKGSTICHRCPLRSGYVDNVRIEIYYSHKKAHAQSIRHCSPIYLFNKRLFTVLPFVKIQGTIFHLLHLMIFLYLNWPVLHDSGGWAWGGAGGFFSFVSVFEAFESCREIWSDSPNHSLSKCL